MPFKNIVDHHNQFTSVKLSITVRFVSVSRINGVFIRLITVYWLCRNGSVEDVHSCGCYLKNLKISSTLFLRTGSTSVLKK